MKCGLFPIIFQCLIFAFSFSPAIAETILPTYIVHVKVPDGVGFVQSEDLEAYYQSFLPDSTSSLNSEQRIVYSYRNVVTGFAAKLTPEEAKAMEEKEGFVSAHQEKVLPLHTTHTPNFLGLNQGLGFWNQSNLGKGVIIGVLDTGLWPDHPSFSDKGMPPPPAKWKGKCEFNGTSCNNKLIGARNYPGTEPPLDRDGHGTHTASTAAGNFVKGANVLGNANGTAAGMAPYAHLAIYKVCSEVGCSESAILAALDDAIEDGVDVISMSLGGGSSPFFADSIAIGAFSAMQKGIFVSCSAGNEGPEHGTLSNEAPWILTVGASTVDRSIKATASLGNGEQFDGESLYQPQLPALMWPLVYAGANGDVESALCGPESLRNVDVKGKIVLCERGGGIARIDKGQEVKNAGGFGMILMNQEPDGYSTLADAHVVPATHVSYAAGLKIKAYINLTTSPMATIVFKGTVIGNSSAPIVASFSSRGPNLASPGILKPDIIGPGVSILAAWPFPLENNTIYTKSTFNMISGTSMSCPHLSGIAALLKSAHPDWSPAAIKSAIMTTADIVNLQGKPIPDQTLLPADIFAIGAGHVNPPRASDPGLIYDIQPDNYISYLCGLNYTDDEVGTIVGRAVKCSEVSSIAEAELNYPSFSVALGDSSQTFTRRITNVGEDGAQYRHEIVAPPGVDVKIFPDGIIFWQTNLTAAYQVTFSKTTGGIGLPFAQGYLKWYSEKHSVRSPILVKFV